MATVVLIGVVPLSVCISVSFSMSTLSPFFPQKTTMGQGTESANMTKFLVTGEKVTRVGFEPTPGYPDEKPAEAGKLSLESHALDRSAILPCKYGGLVKLCHVRWMSNGFSCGHLQILPDLHWQSGAAAFNPLTLIFLSLYPRSLSALHVKKALSV